MHELIKPDDLPDWFGVEDPLLDGPMQRLRVEAARDDPGGRLLVESLTTQPGVVLLPQEYVVRARLARAGRLLRRTAVPLGQVATDCGLADLSP